MAERRARLVARHRLDPAARAADPLEIARSLVCLHATDAVTVFLSIQARSEGVTPADVERALYDERSLVRLLAMRRTLWAVPRDLVPVVFAAATRAVAARERKRLEGFVRDSGVASRPGPWLTRAGNAALAAVAARGEAMTREVVTDVPLLAKKLRFGSGRWVVEQSAGARVLPQLAMEGRLVRGRPRGSWISPQFRWVTTEDWLGGPIEELDVAAAQAELVRRWLAAFGPGDRDRHPLVDGLDRPRGTRGTGRSPACRGRPRRLDRLRPRRRSRARGAARPVGGAAPDARPDDDGLEGARVVPRPARAGALRHERQRRADGLVGRPRRRRLVTAARRRDRLPAPRGRRLRRRTRRRGRGRPRGGLGRRRALLARLPAAVPARACRAQPDGEPIAPRPRSGRL